MRTLYTDGILYILLHATVSYRNIIEVLIVAFMRLSFDIKLVKIEEYEWNIIVT